MTDCFRDDLGVDAPETRRKTITFFLHSARMGDVAQLVLPENPWRLRGSWRATAPEEASAESERSTEGRLAAGDEGDRPDEYDTTVTLGNGGTVTLTVSVNPITLRGKDRTFFFKIVDEFEAFTLDGTASPDVESSDETDEVSTP